MMSAALAPYPNDVSRVTRHHLLVLLLCLTLTLGRETMTMMLPDCSILVLQYITHPAAARPCMHPLQVLSAQLTLPMMPLETVIDPHLW